MASCGILLKATVMCAVLVTLVDITSADPPTAKMSGVKTGLLQKELKINAPEKLPSCCEKVSRQEITDPILGYMVQKRNLPCVAAVIFQTEKGLFCSQVNAPWVGRRIREFEAARRRATTSLPASTVASPSLLSIITSTASPSSSPTASSSPSSSPTVSSSPTSSSSSQ